MFQECYSGVFVISLEKTFEVCDEVLVSEIFKCFYK